MARSSSGFSLIEVLCAILILGIGLVGLTQGITGALGSSKEAEMQTIAAQIAAGQIETLRAEGYVIEGETEGSGGEGLANYEWLQTITETSPAGLYEISVKVRHAVTGRDIYELRTMLFDPPVSTTNSTTPMGSSGRRNRNGQGGPR